MEFEKLRFAAAYLESAQIKMKFEDERFNYTSMVSPKQLNTIKYGYELVDGLQNKLISFTIILGHLKEISDEAAIEIAKVSGELKDGHYDVSELYDYERLTEDRRVSVYGGGAGVYFRISPNMKSQCIDKARSLGYLVPFGGKTIDELLELKWAEYEN